MKNINIKQIASTVTIVIFLSACGGSSNSNNSSDVKVVSVPQCGFAADFGKANAKDVTGKTIKKLGDDAEVRIWHFPDSKKLACMIKGKAKIVNN